MTRAKRWDGERVSDILEAIEKIEMWHPDTSFPSMYQAAILHELMVIGEAASRLSDSFKIAHPEIPWPVVIGQRVQLAHHYWDTQWARIERTIAEDLPELKGALLKK